MKSDWKLCCDTIHAVHMLYVYLWHEKNVCKKNKGIIMLLMNSIISQYKYQHNGYTQWQGIKRLVYAVNQYNEEKIGLHEVYKLTGLDQSIWSLLVNWVRLVYMKFNSYRG